MSNIYEQRFFSALKDTFIGHPIKGKSGYVNLMDLKAQYFAEIEPYIKKEIDKQIEAKYREELFEKLFNFFDCYLNETGTVFFANSQIHKNLYEKVYSDRDDVALFWKTQKLYYVKSEANYEDLQTEVNGINIKFDASEIKHAKGNEKKSIQFFMVKATKDEVVFKIRYQENNKYDRLKTYLDLDKNNDIIDKCIDEYGSDLHPNIVFENTGIDQTVFDKKGDQRKCLYIENLDDALESVKVEYSINDLSLMLQYLHKNGIILYEEDLKKIFSIYKRQNEIDYFIHKDAEGFLKEQFDIYVYNWLFNDLDTDFDVATVKRMQNIKKITHKVIEYIARFEDELKAIWEKPKFVRNCNYVLTLDRLVEHYEIIEKLIESPGWKNQLEEWQNFNLVKNNISFTPNSLTTIYSYLPIDTKHFSKKIKYEILSKFNGLDKELDGVLLKTDNWQGLRTTKSKYSNCIDCLYNDPPYNTNSSPIIYKNNFKDSNWLSIIENRITEAKDFLKKEAINIMAIDDVELRYLVNLLDNCFSKENYITTITSKANPQGRVSNKVSKKTEFHILHSNGILNRELKVPKIGNVSKNSLKRTGTNSRREVRPNRYYPILVKDNKLKMISKDEYLKIYNKQKKEFNDEFIDKLRDKYQKEGFEFVLPLKDDGVKLVWQRTFDRVSKELKTYSYSKGTIQTPAFKYETISDLWTENIFSNPEYGSEYLTNLLGHSEFETPKSFHTIKQFLTLFEDDAKVMDFFGGSGTTADAVIKMNKNDEGSRKFILMDMGEHFYSVIIPRLKKICVAEKWSLGIPGEIEPTSLFFKYYELEQYEEVLAKSQYQWQGKKVENQIEQYSFLQDQKLLDAIEIDYEKKNAKVVFEKLYPDVDMAETLSNLSGKHIKQIFENKVVFEDGSEVIYDEMTFEKYPWIKPLIWWNSK